MLALVFLVSFIFSSSAATIHVGIFFPACLRELCYSISFLVLLCRYFPYYLDIRLQRNRFLKLKSVLVSFHPSTSKRNTECPGMNTIVIYENIMRPGYLTTRNQVENTIEQLKGFRI